MGVLRVAESVLVLGTASMLGGQKAEGFGHLLSPPSSHDRVRGIHLEDRRGNRGQVSALGRG